MNVLPIGRSSVGTELLIGIVVVGLLLFSATHIPVIGFFVSLFIPLLIFFYRLRLGRRIGGIVPVVLGAIMALYLGGASFELLFFFELMVMGYVLGEVLEQRLSVEKTVLLTVGIVMVSGGVCLTVYSAFLGVGTGEMISDYVDRNLQMTMALYQSIGMSEEMIDAVSESLETIRFFLVHVLPALAISSVLFMTWMTLVMAKFVAPRFGLAYPDFGRLNLWRAPEFLIWGVIGSGGILLFADGRLRMAGVNGLIILMTIYFFVGIAIVSYYLEKKQLPLFLRICVYSFIALQQIAFFLVIGIGLFDMWLNFRKLETQKE
ncbi:conserved uncharacterized protein, DUF2232 [Desulfococcus multivorans]|nr:conserved uncharacterized protein, DUF2232 [Desulfococcus multivorans]